MLVCNALQKLHLFSWYMYTANTHICSNSVAETLCWVHDHAWKCFCSSVLTILLSQVTSHSSATVRSSSCELSLKLTTFVITGGECPRTKLIDIKH